MQKLNDKLARRLISISLLITSANSFALGPQTFLGLNYSNPAALNNIHQAEFILGGAELLPDTEVIGTYAGRSGSTSSNTNNFLPYGRLAYRLYPTLVIGIDMTQPAFTGFQYPVNSFINTVAVTSYGRDNDLSPRLSWQATEKLALGIGINFNNLYNTQINFVIPGRGLLTNKADSWAYGFNAGFVYAIDKISNIGFSYYSQIIQHASGVSNVGTVTTQNVKFNVVLPATYSLDYSRMLRSNWYVDAMLHYTVWSPFRYIVIENSAVGNITLPLHYYNNFDYSLVTKYDYNSKWSLLGKVEYNPAFQPTAYMTPGYPIFNGFIMGAGAQYAMSKGLYAKFIYGHAFGNPALHTTLPGGTLTGRMHIPANLYDFSITYDV